MPFDEFIKPAKFVPDAKIHIGLIEKMNQYHSELTEKIGKLEQCEHLLGTILATFSIAQNINFAETKPEEFVRDILPVMQKWIAHRKAIGDI